MSIVKRRERWTRETKRVLNNSDSQLSVAKRSTAIRKTEVMAIPMYINYYCLFVTVTVQ